MECDSEHVGVLPTKKCLFLPSLVDSPGTLSEADSALLQAKNFALFGEFSLAFMALRPVLQGNKKAVGQQQQTNNGTKEHLATAMQLAVWQQEKAWIQEVLEVSAQYHKAWQQLQQDRGGGTSVDNCLYAEVAAILSSGDSQSGKNSEGELSSIAIQLLVDRLLTTPRCVFTWKTLARVLQLRCHDEKMPEASPLEVKYIRNVIVPCLQLRDRPFASEKKLLRIHCAELVTPLKAAECLSVASLGEKVESFWAKYFCVPALNIFGGALPSKSQTEEQ